MGFLRRERDPARVIENELAALHKRRADLEQHLAAATKAVDAANAERRRLLLETDALDSAAIDRAEAACVAAANRVAGTEDAARHLGEEVADAEQR